MQARTDANERNQQKIIAKVVNSKQKTVSSFIHLSLFSVSFFAVTAAIIASIQRVPQNRPHAQTNNIQQMFIDRYFNCIKYFPIAHRDAKAGSLREWRTTATKAWIHYEVPFAGSNPTQSDEQHQQEQREINWSFYSAAYDFRYFTCSSFTPLSCLMECVEARLTLARAKKSAQENNKGNKRKQQHTFPHSGENKWETQMNLCQWLFYVL